MGKFGVKHTKEKALRKRMRRLKIREKDLEENFLRSGGPGGQHADKSSTRVQLKHVPTGIVVTADRERSQAVNRFLARRKLARKIEEKLLGKKSREQREIEKIRKQKDRRRRRSKQKLESDGCEE